MKVSEALGAARDALSVKRVYAEPYEKDGLTVIAAAAVTGGAGGGSGTDPKGQQGEGGGYGANARPVGAYVIKGGQVNWQPAIDPNRIITMVGLIAIAYLLRRPRSTKPDGTTVGQSAAAHPGVRRVRVRRNRQRT